MRKKILAALQMGSDPKGKAETLSQILSYENEIQQSNCDLLVLPEALLGGYPKGSDFGTKVGYRDIWQASMSHIAYEGRNFLVSACQFQPPPTGDIKDTSWPKDKPLIRGGSVIISPMGEVLVGPLYDGEGLIFADVDLDDIVKARYDMDPTGHYSRPDIFSLTVNEDKRPALNVVNHTQTDSQQAAQQDIDDEQ